MRKPQAQRGDILIEVLMAVLVMGIGLLGIAALQVTALRNNQSAMQRSQAAVQVHAIMDAMRANRTVAIADGYTQARTCTAPSGSTLAKADLARWITALQSGLGSTACGTVACSSGLCTVTVDWDDSHASDINTSATTSLASGASKYTVSVSAQL